MRFTPTEFTAAERALQDEVRSFLAAELPPGSHEPGLGMSARHDRAFSAKMAERGWREKFKKRRNLEQYCPRV